MALLKIHNALDGRNTTRIHNSATLKKRLSGRRFGKRPMRKAATYLNEDHTAGGGHKKIYDIHAIEKRAETRKKAKKNCEH